MKNTLQAFVLGCLLATGAQAQTSPSVAGQWVGTVGSSGLELRIEQEGSLLSGYGDMAVPGSTFITCLGGSVNSSGGSVLTMEAEEGAPYDELTVAVTFEGESAQAQVITETGQTLGTFTLERQGALSPKLWDDYLPIGQYFSTVEEYIFRPLGVDTTLNTRLQGVVGTEIVGRWDASQGVKKPFIATFYTGTAAAWNPVFVGKSLIVFKDNSTVLDLGGAFFPRFSTGAAGRETWTAPWGRPLRLGNAFGYDTGSVDFLGK